ncbi:hypothetical protein [Nocardioides aurantiacus]|uniref:Uncharacterized protein n=1 Tax=Nocardioides aurantiacus TaxID=86796 RepID=A0A3N2CW46_9ACTN|nr:hypothetical protein [Nocardioides aurantiacus]ROR91750.1 hypothetical protein EDD33_2625 [Nocardioides aurantiacus]
MALSQLAAAKQRPVGRCQVCIALVELPSDEAAALRQMLADPAWRYTELSDALAADKDYPLHINGDVLGKHARGKCAGGEKLR